LARVLVSVIVPERDEARNLPRLLASLRALRGVDVEILVVDGGSADGSRGIAEAAGVRVLDEPPLPEGWVGKCWACWTGRQAARGEWLLFTDADTWHAPDSLANALARRGDAKLVTGLTMQELETAGERLVMPPVFSLIHAAVGGEGEDVIHDPSLAVANGQYILIEAATYDAIGGHAAVKGSVIEDLALARLAASQGVPAKFLDLSRDVRVRMYRGWREMFAGWRKSVASGAARTPPLAFLATALLFTAGLLALPTLLVALALRAWLVAGLAAAAWLLVTWRVRRASATAEGPRAWHALLHVVGFAFFAVVLAASAFDHATGRGATWKGRRYRTGR
jgi:hypothetical protein